MCPLYRVTTRAIAPLLHHFAQSISNGIIVEIGVFGGANLIHLHDICEPNSTRVVGIDPFETIVVFNGRSETQIDSAIRESSRQVLASDRRHLQEAIRRHDLAPRIELKVGTSWELAEQTFADGSIDLLHIDGDHSYDGVLRDLDCLYKKVKVNGVVILDDINWPAVRKAFVAFVRANSLRIDSQEQHAKLWFHKPS